MSRAFEEVMSCCCLTSTQAHQITCDAQSAGCAAWLLGCLALASSRDVEKRWLMLNYLKSLISKLDELICSALSIARISWGCLDGFVLLQKQPSLFQEEIYLKSLFEKTVVLFGKMKNFCQVRVPSQDGIAKRSPVVHASATTTHLSRGRARTGVRLGRGRWASDGHPKVPWGLQWFIDIYYSLVEWNTFEF